MTSVIPHINRALLATIAGPAYAGRVADQSVIIEQAARALPAMMHRFEITTPLRAAHFLAQLAHESANFSVTEEFSSGALYEGRKDLGNIQKGDGIRFKGRGLIQCTGRSNYSTFTSWMKYVDNAAPNFIASPAMLEEFPWAAWSAVWFWDTRRLNVVADRDDLVQVTKIINGGRNGLDDRAAKLSRAKTVLAKIGADAISEKQNGFPVLYRGIKGQSEAVERLQRLLSEACYYDLSIDGDFGPGTEAAVRAFQHRTKLDVDGIAGARTMSALNRLLGTAN